MKNRQYYINGLDSIGRCPCAKCGSFPAFARRDDGVWVGFCPNCHGFEGINPDWFVRDKEAAVFNWSVRQLVWDICNGVPQEI